MSRKRAKALSPGDRVATNARLARMFGWPDGAAMRGAIVGPHPHIHGCWRVRVDNVPPMQYVHEKFLEREDAR